MRVKELEDQLYGRVTDCTEDGDDDDAADTYEEFDYNAHRSPKDGEADGSALDVS